MDVTQDMIYEYIRKKGGRVKNVDLVKHFRKHLQFEDVKKKEQAREAFKETVNAVAVIKQEEGEKFLYMKDDKQFGSSLKRTSASVQPQPNAILDPQVQRKNSGSAEPSTSSLGSQAQRRSSSGTKFSSTSSNSPERRRPPPVPNTSLSYTASAPNLPNGQPSVSSSQPNLPNKLYNGLGPSSDFHLEQRGVVAGVTSPRRPLLSPPASSSKANRTSFVVPGSPKHQSSPAPAHAPSSLGGSHSQLYSSPVRHSNTGLKKARGNVAISGPVNVVSLSNGLSTMTDSPPDRGSSMLEQMTMELQNIGTAGLLTDLTSTRISPPRELIVATASAQRPASVAPCEASSMSSVGIHSSAPSSSLSHSTQFHSGLVQQTSPQHRPNPTHSNSPQHHISPTHMMSPQHLGMLNYPSQVASSSGSIDGQEHASPGLGVKQLIDKYSPGSSLPQLVVDSSSSDVAIAKVSRSSSIAGADSLAIRREGTPPDGISVRRAVSNVGGGTLRRSRQYNDNLQNITRQSIKGISNRTKLQHRLSKNSEDLHDWQEFHSVPVQDPPLHQLQGEEGDRDSPIYQEEYVIEIDPLEREWIHALIDDKLDSIRRIIMEDGTYVNRRGFLHGWTALHWAAKLGKKELLNALILSGAKVDIRSNGGMTPLHLACESGNLDIIENLVIDHHASVNIRERSGKKPLDVISDNAPEHIRALLRNGLTHFKAPRNASIAIAVGPLKSFNIPRPQQITAAGVALQKGRWASAGNVQDKEINVDKLKKHKQHHLLSPPGVRKGFSFRKQKKYSVSKESRSS